MQTTISIAAHPDDDLLFMNPDLASDVQAGLPTWIVYLTAGNLTRGAAGMPYADGRIHGVRAAWARAARKADRWTFERCYWAGREVAVNYLDAQPRVRLVHLYLNAANGPDDGDLSRMWRDPGYVAAPIDGRAPYRRADLAAVLRAMIAEVDPTFLRCLDPWGEDMGGHIDHFHAARFALDANLDADGCATRRCDTYFDYILATMPENFTGYWRDEKLAIWNAYKPHDTQVAPAAWDELAGRQHRRRIYWPGDTCDLL